MKSKTHHIEAVAGYEAFAWNMSCSNVLFDNGKNYPQNFFKKVSTPANPERPWNQIS